MDLARIAGSRWAVEECFQQAKNQAGLDEYQVRDWRAWYAHITLSMAAHAWLVVARTLAQKGNQRQPAHDDRLHRTRDQTPARRTDRPLPPA
jgi:SRSO17 transposase